MDVNPFVLFPTELWDMILDYVMGENPVESSKDVLSLIQAYPVLEVEFPALKEVCLILQVLPILAKKKYYNFNERQFLKCRLYNKRWCRAVDVYLNSKSLQEVSFFLPRSTFEERGSKSVAQFMKKMENHPASRNPFITNKRQMTIMASPELKLPRGEGNGGLNARDWASDAEAQEKYMGDILKMLEKYGKHIWNLKFEFDCSFFGVHHQPLLWANFGKMLQLLPNLKYFNLFNSYDDFHLRKPEENVFREYLGSPLPDLPRLEELTVCFGAFETYQTEVNLWTQFVHRYALQLTKLELEAIDNSTNSNYGFKFLEISPPSVSFPELKTLVYTHDVYMDFDNQSVSYLMSNVLTISAPKLEIIELHIDETEMNLENNPDKEWKQQLQKLKRFPTLKQFEIDFCHFGDKDLSVEEDSLLALTDFSMLDDEGATYKMLLCFPNLERLQIWKIGVCNGEYFISRIGKKKMRKEIRSGRFFKDNIWEWLPKLESFCFSGSKISLELSREKYEQMKTTDMDKRDEDYWIISSILKYVSDRVK